MNDGNFIQIPMRTTDLYSESQSRDTSWNLIDSLSRIKNTDMKRRSTIFVVAGIAIAAVISVVAVATHLRLSALEPEGHGNETPEQIAQEILTGQPAHSEENETRNNSTMSEGAESGESHSESEETPEEKAAEGK